MLLSSAGRDMYRDYVDVIAAKPLVLSQRILVVGIKLKPIVAGIEITVTVTNDIPTFVFSDLIFQRA